MKLGLGTMAVGGASFLGIMNAAAAEPGIGGLSARGLLDGLISPTNGLILVDRGTYYQLKTNGLPDHETGMFPNPNCPGPILAQSNPLKIAKSPQVAARTTALNGWLFGVCVNGVALDPTGPFYRGEPGTGWHFEVMSALARPQLGLDANNAHTQPSGEYHYHGLPTGLIQRLQREQAARKEKSMVLIGFAADGFPIYAPVGHKDPRDPKSPLVEMRSSYQLKSGQRPAGGPGGKHASGIFVQDFEYRPGVGDLDDCNGRFGVTPEYPQGIYHYFVTSAFPFIPRSWKGTPDQSFFHPLPIGPSTMPKKMFDMDFSTT